MNIHTTPRTIYFARVCPFPTADSHIMILSDHHFKQSGQSLIEHSYKADSDLSPAGWEYAERLKAAVIARRKALRKERKANGETIGDENPLLVCTRFTMLSFCRLIIFVCRFGRRLGEEHTSLHGHLYIPDTRLSKNQSCQKSTRRS